MQKQKKKPFKRTEENKELRHNTGCKINAEETGVFPNAVYYANYTYENGKEV